MVNASLKQVARFFIKILLMIFLILLLDRGIGTVLKILYFRQDSGPGYRTTYSIDSTSANIIILGSSRATHHYVPDVFEENLHLTFYNAGRDGISILYKYAIFKSITKRYTPDFIIYDLSPNDLQYFTDEYDRLSILLPYYKTHPEIKNIINLRNPFEEIKQISSIYPFNSLLIEIVLGNLEYTKKRNPENKGYLPIYKTLKSFEIDTAKINYPMTIDENKTNALKDIISTCKQKNIELTLVYSPVWQVQQNSVLNNLISEMCSDNGINFIDMSNDTAFINNPQYFADQFHLNEKGARLFSKNLIDKMSRVDIMMPINR